MGGCSRQTCRVAENKHDMDKYGTHASPYTKTVKNIEHCIEINRCAGVKVEEGAAGTC